MAGTQELATKFRALMDAVHSIEHLAGFCYTQLADTYQEINGLLTAAREPKLPLDIIALAVRDTPSTSFDPLATQVDPDSAP